MNDNSRRTLREARARFARAPLPTRLYILGRTTAFPPVCLEPYVGHEGPLSSFGCGVGIMEVYLALRFPSLGIDASDRNHASITIARAAAPSNVHFRVLDVTADPLPPRVPAILLVDVLHHISRDQQGRVIARCYEALKPGGRIIVKDLDLLPRWKWAWNYVQDVIMTRGKLPFIRSAGVWRGMFEAAGFEVDEHVLDTPLPYAHILFVGTKPA